MNIPDIEFTEDNEDAQMLLAVALSQQILGPGDANENPVKIFLNRFARKNAKGKILNDVSINRFNILLYQAKASTLTEDDIILLTEIIEVYAKNFTHLVQYEELWAPLKISFGNIIGFYRVCMNNLWDQKKPFSDPSKKRVLEGVLKFLKLVFKIGVVADHSQENTSTLLAKIEKSLIGERLSEPHSEDQAIYESTILVGECSVVNKVQEYFVQDLVFSEDGNNEKVQRVLKPFLQGEGEFIQAYSNSVVQLIINSVHQDVALQFISSLSSLVSKKKVCDSNTVCQLIQLLLSQVILNPTSANIDLYTKISTDATIQEHFSNLSRLQLFCNLISGLGKMQIKEGSGFSFEELLDKVILLFKNYADTMSLKGIDQSTEENLSFLQKLFEDSFSFMENMSMISEAEMHREKSKQSAISSAVASGVASINMKLPSLSLEKKPSQKLSERGLYSEIQEIAKMEEEIFSMRNESLIDSREIKRASESFIRALKNPITKKLEEEKKEEPKPKQKAQPEPVQKKEGQKMFEGTLQTVQNLFIIFKKLNEVEALEKQMGSGLQFEVLQKLVKQINQFYMREKQIAIFLTKIALLFINPQGTFTLEFTKQFCSFFQEELLRGQTQPKQQYNNEQISIYVKTYLSLSACKNDNAIAQEMQQTNDQIVDFFLEGVQEVKNYHLLLLNILSMQIQSEQAKQQLINKLLNNCNAMNKNILILLLLIYSLLVVSTHSILDNHTKQIISQLLSQTSIVINNNGTTSSNEKPAAGNTKDKQSQSTSTQSQQQQDDNSNNQNGEAMNMSDDVQIDQFMRVNKTHSVKKLPKLNTSNGSINKIGHNGSVKSLDKKQSELFCELINRLNTNTDIILDKNGNSSSIQILFSLLIQLNQIAQTLDPNFQQSQLLVNFSFIHSLNSNKQIPALMNILNQNLTQQTCSQPALIGILLKTLQLQETVDHNSSKNSNEQNQMVIEAPECSTINVEAITVSYEQCLINGLTKMKDLQKESEEFQSLALDQLIPNINATDKQVLLYLLRQHSLSSSSSRDSKTEVEQINTILEKLDIENTSAIEVIEVLGNKLNSDIDTQLTNLYQHLHKQPNAIYITELLSILSHPLNKLKPQLALKLADNTKLLHYLNAFLLPKFILKLLPNVFHILFSHLQNHLEGNKLKNISEEVLLEGLNSYNQYWRFSESKEQQSVQTFFNSEVYNFSQYLFKAEQSKYQEYEKQTFVHLLSKFIKFTNEVNIINIILECTNQSSFVQNALSWIIINTLKQVKSSPLNLKALCIAFSQSCQSADCIDGKLFSLCQKYLANYQLSNRKAHQNLLVDLLLNYPERQADRLLQYSGMKGVNLKEKLWFPVSELAKTCFASSDIELQYELDGKLPENAEAAAKKEESQKAKALLLLQKEVKSSKESFKVLEAFEKMSSEKFVSLDAQIQQANYETNKNIFFNTEHIANFKQLTMLFTSSFLSHFQEMTQQHPQLLASLIRDCEISPSKITLSDSEEKNKVMKVCFVELMSLFESILKESKELNKQFVKELLGQAANIIYTIAKETEELSSECIQVIGYNCERIIQVAHFIFTNSIKFMPISDLSTLIRDLFAFALSLGKLDNSSAQKYSVQILLLLVMHVRQADSQNAMEIESNEDNNKIQQQQLQEQLEKQQQQENKMETEQTREELQQELDKKFNTIPKEVQLTSCTLEVHKRKAESQPFYNVIPAKCYTCEISDQSYVLCSWCAYNCHNGHDLAFFRQSKGTCDCVDKGPQGSCKAKGVKREASNIGSLDSPRDGGKPHIQGIIDQFQNNEIPPELINYYLKDREREEKQKFGDERMFQYERKQGLFSLLQEDKDDSNNGDQNEVIFNEGAEEEEKNEEELFSSDSESLMKTERNISEIEANKKNLKVLQQQQQQKEQKVAEGENLLQNVISELKQKYTSKGLVENIFSKCENQLNSLLNKWSSISSGSDKQVNETQLSTVDFLSSPLVLDAPNSKTMDNQLGKIVCKLNKSGGLDMQVREDSYSDSNFYLIQGGYSAQPVAPMIIRKPIDFNGENIIAVTSGTKVLLIDKQLLFSRIGANLKAQLSSGSEDTFSQNRLLQLSTSDLSIAQSIPLEFSVMHVKFSQKNPQIVAICGLTQILIAKITDDFKFTKSNIIIPQKNFGEYVNKLIWIPFSEQYFIVMNLKCIKLFQIKTDTSSCQLITKFNANDVSGIFKDFTVIEHPTKPNEFVVLVACADGRVYYQEFGTQQKEDVIFTTYLNMPSDLIPKGQVCMGLSYSPSSFIMSVSYKNGTNLFGRLDLKQHKLTNCFVYKPLSSQNKNGLLQFIEKSGEIMTNANELHVDESQCLTVTTLRDPNNQSNYSIQSGYLTAVKFQRNSIHTQPLETSLLKISDERKCEGYCFLKCKEIEGIKFVMSLHEDGSLNMFGLPIDDSSLHSMQKRISEALTSKPKGAKKDAPNEENSEGEQGNANQLGKVPNPFGNDPSFKVLKEELKLSDLGKNPILQVDFAEKYSQLKQNTDIILEVNKVKQDALLFNEKPNVIIQKNDPQEIVLKCQSRQCIITGVRVKMQIPPHTGQGIFKLKVFNREIKLLNTSSDDKKMVDISLSTLEIIYVYLHNLLSFTLSSFSPISTTLKMASAHEIKLISVEPYGGTINQFQLKEKLEQLKACLNIRQLQLKEEVVEEEQTANNKLIEQSLVNSKEVQSIDFIKRKIILQANIQLPEVVDFLNQLDIFTVSLDIASNSNQQQQQQNLVDVQLEASRLKAFINKLKTLLINPNIDGKFNEYFLAAVKRVLKSTLKVYASLVNEKIILTHPYEYQTFKTLARVEYFNEQLQNEKASLKDLLLFLQQLLKLSESKMPLIYTIFILHPTILKKLNTRFLELLKGDFDQNISNSIIVLYFKLIILYFHFLRNKPTKQDKIMVEEEQNKEDPGKEAFELFEKLMVGLQGSNLKQKLLIPIKELLQLFKQENSKPQQSEKYEFSFDLVSLIPKLESQEIKKKSSSKKPASKEPLIESNDIEIASDNQMMDAQLRFSDQYQMEEFEGEGMGGMFAGYENMNEEEMMKLAIEMSLKDKNNSSNVAPAGNNSSSKKFEDKEQIEEMDEGDDGIEEEEKRMREDEYEIEFCSHHSDKIEQEEYQDIQDSMQEIEEQFPSGFESIKIGNSILEVQPQDISVFFTTSLLQKLQTSSGRKSMQGESLLPYLFLISHLLKLPTSQTQSVAYQLAQTFYSLVASVDVSYLSNSNSDEAKTFVFAIKILTEVIKSVQEADKVPKSKEATAPSDEQPQYTDFIEKAPSAFSNNQLESASSAAKKQKESTEKPVHHIDSYKVLRQNLQSQLIIFEQKEKAVFLDKTYEIIQVMVKHFESSRCSLKIEYANGEIVNVSSKVALRPSEIISQCFRNIDEFTSKTPLLMQVVDQIIFGSIMSLLYHLVLLQKQLLRENFEQKWSILLSQLLVSPTTSVVYSSRTERLLQLLMKTSSNYYEIRDRIALHKEFEIAQRIHLNTQKFQSVSYEQLLVIVQSFAKIFKIASDRRFNWLNFCNQKQEVIPLIYDAILNNVKGCVENSLRLVSLYYAPPISI